MKSFLLALCAMLIHPVGAADVEVTVEGVERAGGSLLIGFYNNEADFRVNHLEYSMKIPVAAPGTITALAEGVPPGTYAIAVVWDLNDNGKMDTKGRLNRPTEPVGFSNNPKLRFGPPKYRECSFVVEEPGKQLTIVLLK